MQTTSLFDFFSPSEFSRVDCLPSSIFTNHGMPQHLQCSFHHRGEEVKLDLIRNSPHRYQVPVYSFTDQKVEQETRDDLEAKVWTESDTEFLSDIRWPKRKSFMKTNRVTPFCPIHSNIHQLKKSTLNSINNKKKNQKTNIYCRGLTNLFSYWFIFIHYILLPEWIHFYL